MFTDNLQWNLIIKRNSIYNFPSLTLTTENIEITNCHVSVLSFVRALKYDITLIVRTVNITLEYLGKDWINS